MNEEQATKEKVIVIGISDADACRLVAAAEATAREIQRRVDAPKENEEELPEETKEFVRGEALALSRLAASLFGVIEESRGLSVPRELLN